MRPEDESGEELSAGPVEWQGAMLPVVPIPPGASPESVVHMLLWIGPAGELFGRKPGTPRELLGEAVGTLIQALDAAKVGGQPSAGLVRISDPALAGTVRAGQDRVEIVEGPTPDALPTLVALVDALIVAHEEEPPYLDAKATPAAAAAFFRAAAAYYRTRVWERLPSDPRPIHLRIEELEIFDSVLSPAVLGKGRIGLAVFADLDDFRWCSGGTLRDDGERPNVATGFMELSFRPLSQVGKVRQAELEAQRWEIADAEAYPHLCAVEADGTESLPNTPDFHVFEAVLRAMTTLRGQEAALAAAWDGRGTFERSVDVVTEAGPLQVRLLATDGRDAPEDGGPWADLEAFFDERPTIERIDERELLDIEDGLYERFGRASEGNHPCPWFRTVLHLANVVHNATLVDLRPDELRDIVFEQLPKVCGAEPAEAGAIISECRVWLAGIDLRFGLPMAEGCLGVLGGTATEKLSAALSRSTRRRERAAIAAAAEAAGFALDASGALIAWTTAIRLGTASRGAFVQALVPEAPVRGDTHRKDGRARRDKKSARKAASKARKKNR